MAQEVLHEHHVHHDEGSSLGFITGIFLLIVALFLFVYYLLPTLRGAGTQINIPGRIDVNLRQTR